MNPSQTGAQPIGPAAMPAPHLAQERAHPHQTLRATRLSLAGTSLFHFAQLYLRHHLHRAPASFHPELFADLSAGITRHVTGQQFRYAAAVPQGYGKSTIAALALPMWCLAFGHARHIALLTASRAASAERIEHIHSEMETNERLRHDFPHLARASLRAGVAVTRLCNLVIAGGMRLAGMYRKSPAQILMHQSRPPELIIADDLDGQSRPGGKDLPSTWEWWDRMIEPGLGEAASIVMVGSPRFMIDLLMHRVVCGPELGWCTRRYAAITKYPSDLSALRTFEHIYRERIAVGGQTGPAAARAWLSAAAPYALQDAEVAWPEKESLLRLVTLKARIGWMAFDAIKQCRPLRVSQFCSKLLLPGAKDAPKTLYPRLWTDDAGLERAAFHRTAHLAELIAEEGPAPAISGILARPYHIAPPIDDREFYRLLEQVW